MATAQWPRCWKGIEPTMHSQVDEVFEPLDEHFGQQVSGWQPGDARLASVLDPVGGFVDVDRLLACFDAQAQSRHLDLAARWLQRRGVGFYTIGSSGHESNAAVALALRPTDPALLHYRSGGFYCARAQQVPGTTPITDVLSGVAAATSDPISGGRHKVFGNHSLAVIPQTSTIGSHLPRAFGLAFSIGRAAALGHRTPWPADAVVVASFGDASVNHSTTVGALNATAYCTSRGLPVPLAAGLRGQRVRDQYPNARRLGRAVARAVAGHRLPFRGRGAHRRRVPYCRRGGSSRS